MKHAKITKDSYFASTPFMVWWFNEVHGAFSTREEAKAHLKLLTK